MPQLIIEQPGVPPMTVPIKEGELRLGRADDCDVVLVADEVSRHHAKIVRRGRKTLLMDLKSLNGTYVNRQRIIERVLSHLDEIWFGSKCRLIYRDDTQFGRPAEEDKTPKKESDSALLREMKRIRGELDTVGKRMTVLAQKREISDAEKTSLITPDDVVKMGRAYRRLAALYRASRVMASNFNLHDRLAMVLDSIMEVLGADRGFVMLREEGTHNLTVKVARHMGRELDASSPSMGIAGRAAIDGEPVLMSSRESDRELGMRESIIRNRITSAMCVPLRIEDRIVGSIYVDTCKPDVRFTEEDLELFMSLAAQSALAIDHVRLHEKALEEERRRLNFGRFLSPAIVEKILHEDTSLELGGQKTRVTTLFCDIRGSSHLAERLSPHELVHLLNEHFSAMTEIIFDHDGTLDKFIGDEFMAVFGAPFPVEQQEYRAVSTAFEIIKKNEELNQLRRETGRPTLEVGIGINTGEVIAGYIGSPKRLEFTVVGDHVNTAKRLCDRATAGKIVIGSETFEAVKEYAEATPIGTVVLRGKQKPVHAYELVSLRQSFPRS